MRLTVLNGVHVDRDRAAGENDAKAARSVAHTSPSAMGRGGDSIGDPRGNRATLAALKRVVLQRKPMPSLGGCPECAPAAPCANCAAKAIDGSPGEPLGHGLRAELEPRFAADLSDVRVHADSGAAKAAAHARAQAFTVGSHVVFSRGSWAPQSAAGKRLLAHELTHVVQQRHSSPVGGAAVSDADNDSEREADANADRVDGTAALTARAAPSAAMPRKEDNVSRADDEGDVCESAPDDAAPLADKDPAPEGPVSRVGSPAGQTVEFEGITLAINSDYMVPLAHQYIVDHGTEELRQFVRRYEGHMLDTVLLRTITGEGDPSELLSDPIGDALFDAARIAIREDRKWIDDIFGPSAVNVTFELLQASLKSVTSEATRYGVRFALKGIKFFGGLDIDFTTDDNLSTRRLGIAAGGLARRKRALDAAISQKWAYTNELNRYGSGPEEAAEEDAMAELGRLDSAVDLATRDLEVYRAQVEPSFPVLLEYDQNKSSDYDGLDSLANLKPGPNADASTTLGKLLFEKVGNIVEVRDALESGDLNVWRVPRIVEETERRFGGAIDPEKKRVIDEKVEDEQPSALTGVLIGIAQIGLVLLGPLTEGASLIPAAMISGGVAYEHLKEYRLESALHGTDFGPLALSQKDPSLFWLGVDIVAAGFDASAAAGAAFRIFNKLAPLARAAEEAKFSEESVEALAQEARAAGAGGEALAKQIEKRLGEAAGERVGTTVEEAHEAEQAATDLGEALAKDPHVAVADTLGGGHVKVAPGGGIWVCHSPCATMGERYAAVLTENPKLGERYGELVNRAKTIPEGEAGAVAREQLAREAAAFDGELRLTAREGQVRSPMANADFSKGSRFKSFDEMAKARGSLEPTIDFKPPNWTGRDEALFRYGPDASLDAREYTWVMDADGELSIRNLSGSSVSGPKPDIMFNPVAGEFVEIGDDILRAKKGPRGMATLAAGDDEKLAAIFAEREEAVALRDSVEGMERPLREVDDAALTRARADVVDASRRIGETASDSAMREMGATRIYPMDLAKPSTAGDFDQVWKLNGKYYVIEAKGGSSGLGTRMTEFGRAEQGTAEYFESIAKNMERTGATKDIRALGKDLNDARLSDNVVYLMARTPVGEEGVKATQFIQFLLK